MVEREGEVDGGGGMRPSVRVERRAWRGILFWW